MNSPNKFKKNKNLREFLVFIIDEYLDHSDDNYFMSEDFRKSLEDRYTFKKEVDLLVFNSMGLVNGLNECMEEYHSKIRSPARFYKEELAGKFYMLDGWKEYLDGFSFERKNGTILVKH